MDIYESKCLKKLVAKLIKNCEEKERNDRRKRKRNNQTKMLKVSELPEHKKSAIQLTKESSKITKLRFSKCSHLFAIFFFFFREEREKGKTCGRPVQSVFSVIVKHTHSVDI